MALTVTTKIAGQPPVKETRTLEIYATPKKSKKHR
jgi:hypothetical protein